MLYEPDLYLYHQGNLFQSYQLMGAHLAERNGMTGVRFTVWAPNARQVGVAGDFNGWNGMSHPMERAGESGLWTVFIPELGEGTPYKYEIHTGQGERILKSDPYAFFSEVRPNTASIVTELNGFEWTDKEWQRKKRLQKPYSKPMNIYEVHLGSWRIKGIEDFYTYEELAESLVDYVVEAGFTHIEILPLSEHPYDGSWGYQITGYYSLTSRYGTPRQFQYLVNRCHEKGIGVLLDWVPGHFCKDAHGLRLFDGSPLYEYADPNRAEKPLWGTLTFDFGKPEVQSFLISNALFWMEVYHIDGLRVDAVASMMQRNFDKPESMWTFNEDGSTEDLNAIAFLKKLNETVFRYHPNALMIAEDSSDTPLVSAPTYEGGLGFNFKWNMGWMNDMLRYMKLPPEQRSRHHNLITFSLMYAFTENFVLPLSHDEVVHGKKSLLDKMPGDYWKKFANYRLLYAYWMTHPGKKLMFMGGEFAQFAEWKDREELDWLLLDYEMHRKFQGFSKGMNTFYKEQEALWERDHDPDGFEWIDADNAGQSIVSFIRRGKKRKDDLIVVANFTPEVYHEFRMGVPARGEYEEVFNSDDARFGGSGQRSSAGVLHAKALPFHSQKFSIEMSIPPLAVVILKKIAAVRASKEPSIRLSSAKVRTKSKPAKPQKERGTV
ncbi:1,4-alpha-glucan branching protein GlgB [Paenibacillus aurantius]|uniref:1,4-alpha-glucan branching enzyme GlgB n=1 Tax=Paenibacillus aurantius TaxID=2918900 RepID=A0AA96LJ57_9BACL|nr:1,4-alpha-glucan branching protein GlgB [Paenibacillus aurantius]WNQ14265.1 1,4-alpha-glucan branching protein GlgB [Paenibacillus aurantius]